MPVVRCLCRCHRAIESVPTPFYVGVDVRDPLATACACGGYIDNHCAALLDQESRPLREPRIVHPEPSTNYLPPQPYRNDEEDAG